MMTERKRMIVRKKSHDQDQRPGRHDMRSLFAIAVVALVSTSAEAAQRGGMRFWNLTLYTVTSLQFSAPGQNAWGKNQCENDDDKTVDHNERLRITGLTPGRYDA